MSNWQADEYKGLGFGSQTTLAVTAESKVSDRTIKNWPLDEVDMHTPVIEADFVYGASWPPRRCQLRNDRLRLLRNLYRGDWSHFITDAQAYRVQSNILSRYCDLIGLLLTTTLQGDEDELEEDTAAEGSIGTVTAPSGIDIDTSLIDTLITAIANYMSQGRAYIVVIDGQVFSPYGESCYESDDGTTLFVVTSEVGLDSTDGSPNRLVINAIDREMETATTWTVKWEGRTTTSNASTGSWSIGEVLVEPLATSGNWAVADRPPKPHGNWGTSALVALAPLVMAASLRLTGNEELLQKHQRPLLWIQGSIEDTVRSLSLETALNRFVSGDSISKSEIQDAMQDILSLDVLWQEDSALEPTYITNPSLGDGVAAGLAQVEALKDEIRLMSGLGALLEMDPAQWASGVALRETERPLNWAGAQTHSRIHEAAQQCIGEFAWPSPFDPKMDDTMANETDEEAAIDEDDDDDSDRRMGFIIENADE